jgi:hypothetical protein
MQEASSRLSSKSALGDNQLPRSAGFVGFKSIPQAGGSPLIEIAKGISADVS